MKHRKAVFQGMKADIAGAPVSLAVGPLWWGGVPVSPPRQGSHTRLDPPPCCLILLPLSVWGFCPSRAHRLSLLSSQEIVCHAQWQSSGYPEHGGKLVFVAEAGARESGLLRQHRA